jgi:hypothetical protein
VVTKDDGVYPYGLFIFPLSQLAERDLGDIRYLFRGIDAIYNHLLSQ